MADLCHVLFDISHAWMQMLHHIIPALHRMHDSQLYNEI